MFGRKPRLPVKIRNDDASNNNSFEANEANNGAVETSWASHLHFLLGAKNPLKKNFPGFRIILDLLLSILASFC